MDIREKLDKLLAYHERAVQLFSFSRRSQALTKSAWRWVAKRDALLEEIVQEYEKLLSKEEM